MKISIVTVCYNAKNDLQKTMKSVLEQDYQNLEYNIVDGASSDGTVKLLEEYADKFPQFGKKLNWISEPDEGISDAFNKGIAVCTGELIGIINAGDIYLPNVISRLNDKIDDSHVYYGDMLIHDADYKNIGYRQSCSGAERGLLKCRMGKLFHPTVFIKKVCYNHVKFNLQKKYAMDYDLLLTLYIMKKKFKYLDFAVSSMYPYGLSEKNYHKSRTEGIRSYKHQLNKSGIDKHIIYSYLAIVRTKIRSILEKHKLGLIVQFFRNFKRL